MIRTADHLAFFITETLATKPTCRIYQDALDYCWPPWLQPTKTRQAEEITAFAQRHGWTVTIHTPGHYGRVADFRKNEGAG